MVLQMHIIPRDWGLLGPQVNESHTWVHDPNTGMFQLIYESLMAILKTYIASGAVYAIMFGHMLDSFIQTLGDFEYVSTTAGTIYPVAKVIRKNNNDKEVDSTIEVTSPDHVAFTGRLKSGAIAGIISRAGIKATEGRRHFLWEIDGEDGSIRVEGTSIL
jgi:predicted dehydrogenase